MKKNIDKKRLKNKTNNNQKNKDQIELKKIKGQEREKREENKKIHVSPVYMRHTTGKITMRRCQSLCEKGVWMWDNG